MKKFNFNFLTTLVIASVWLCVSCSHNKKTSTYSGLSEEANEASSEQAAPVEEAPTAEAVPAEAPSEELAAVMAPEAAPQDSAVSEIMELADASPAVVQAQTEVASEPETVTSAPQTLDGSEAGFLSNESELLGSSTPPSPDSFPMDAPVIAPVAEKAAEEKTAQPATRKVRPAQKPAAHKRADAAVQSLEQKAREEQTAKTMREVLGDQEPAVAEAAKPEEEKKEQLASAEVGTFFERHLFWVAVCLVAFFGFAFVSMKRGKNKDMPL